MRDSRLRRPAVVPDIVSGTVELTTTPPLVQRPSGIGYAKEHPADRDRRGVLWLRVASNPDGARGRPEFGRVHPLRQRRVMRRHLCQICSRPASRTALGTLWLIEDHRGEGPDWPEGCATVHPPLCVACAEVSVRLCPHLRDGWAAVRAQDPQIQGVYGQRYTPGLLAPRAQGPGVVRYDTHQAAWVLAASQSITLYDCTLVDLP
ncbi:hypothetical protein ACFQLX_19720 [Streptomyces polyrhachis]|uniref:Recombination endonuclease VII n=1 Tax=Streptomyces polyrhachis TaxID=1282885 RepID=A0ABW2GHZ5_9ACTN